MLRWQDFAVLTHDQISLVSLWPCNANVSRLCCVHTLVIKSLYYTWHHSIANIPIYHFLAVFVHTRLNIKGMVWWRLLQSARLRSLYHWHLFDHMVSHPHYAILNFLVVHFLHLLERSCVLFVHTCHWNISSRIKSLLVSHDHFVPPLFCPF